MGYLNLRGNTDKERRADANRRMREIQRRQKADADAERHRKKLLRRNSWK